MRWVLPERALGLKAVWGMVGEKGCRDPDYIERFGSVWGTRWGDMVDVEDLE